MCTTLAAMSTAYVSGRVPPRYERLVVKQAQAAKTSKKQPGRRYVIEKTLETEFPGISFRNSLSGREAYLSGHRVAVWEVLGGIFGNQVVQKTSQHFRWPSVLVKRALAYAKAFPEKIRRSQEGERHGFPIAADENTSHRLISACQRLVPAFPIVHIANLPRWHVAWPG